jgi:hypothetical protein
MPDPNRQLFVDDRIDSYIGYLSSEWPQRVSDAAKSAPVLDDILLDLLLAWRTTAYTASMPAVFVQSLQTATESYVSTVSPDSSVIAFADAVLARLSRKLPQIVEDGQLRAELAKELVTLTADIRDARATAKVKVPLEPIWRSYLQLDAFAMGVWSSQRVCYVAFYSAYENFLIRCVKQALGVKQLRTTSAEFKPALRSRFGRDILDSCWGNSDMNLARLVRHALSHAGGRETDDLRRHRHKITLVDGVLQIAPDDNHSLLKTLKSAVEALVGGAANLSQFTVKA